jgi:hypothetical protein
MSNIRWQDEVTEAVRTLWAGDLSCAQIAAELNRRFGTSLNKNAIIGKARRLKLNHKPPSGQFRPGHEVRGVIGRGRLREIQKARREGRAKLGGTGETPRQRKNPLAILRRPADTLGMVDPTAPASLNIPLMELETFHCRYPSGEGAEATYCGHQHWNGLAYCEYHARRCYLPGSSLLGLRTARDRKRRHVADKVSTFAGAFA